jgi:putative endonuclease
VWEAVAGGAGRRGERAVARFLRRNGYTILERNFRVRGGEVDILACKDGLVVAVEVKTRTGKKPGSAFQSITPAKKRRIRLAAIAFCRSRGIPASRLRMEAAAVERDGFRLRVTLLPGSLPNL